MEGGYYFFSGIKLQITNNGNGYSIEFNNGTRIKDIVGVKKDETVFNKFHRLTIDSIRLPGFYTAYFWPDGKSIKVNGTEYNINRNTGELLDKNGNVIEIYITDKVEEVEKPKSWWSKLISKK